MGTASPRPFPVRLLHLLMDLQQRPSCTPLIHDVFLQTYEYISNGNRMREDELLPRTDNGGPGADNGTPGSTLVR